MVLCQPPSQQQVIAGGNPLWHDFSVISMKCFSADGILAKTHGATTCNHPEVLYKMLLQSRSIRSAAPMWYPVASHISIRCLLHRRLLTHLIFFIGVTTWNLSIIVCISRYMPEISGNTLRGLPQKNTFGMQNKKTCSNPHQLSCFCYSHFFSRSRFVF